MIKLTMEIMKLPQVSIHIAYFKCHRERLIFGSVSTQHDLLITEIESTSYTIQNRHENVVDEAFDQGSEGSTDNNPHRHIEGVPFECEFLKIFAHGAARMRSW